MKTKGKIVILKRIVDSPFAVSKSSLLQLLENEDIYISTRTLERYLKELSDSFFIEYSKEQKGYIKNSFIDKEELSLFIQLLNVKIITSSILKNNYKKLIYHSSRHIFKGLEHLHPLLECIDKKRMVSFQYKTQYKDLNNRNVIPQFIKEYQNRWYLIGLDIDKENAVRTFGLDRISSIKKGVKITLKNLDNNSSIFENMIGVDTRPSNNTYNYPIEVILKATSPLPNYLKSLPIHSSQKMIKETDGYTLFSLKIFINYEFKQHIYMYSPFIQVVEPKWLVDQIKEDLKTALNIYKK